MAPITDQIIAIIIGSSLSSVGNLRISTSEILDL